MTRSHSAAAMLGDDVHIRPHASPRRLLQHLSQTATSAYLFAGLLNDLAPLPQQERSGWLLFEGLDRDETVAAAAVRRSDGFCLLHGTCEAAVRHLAEYLVAEHAIRKISGEFDVLSWALESFALGPRVYRDHRELFMVIRAHGHQLAPDGNYRLAGFEDIPTLREYAAGYSSERQVPVDLDWARLIVTGQVVLAEALPPDPPGQVASCLLKGIQYGPFASFGGIYTFPNFRGRGYASRLLVNCCVEVFAAGLDACLFVDDDNESAIAAYRRAGFFPVADYRDVYLSASSTTGDAIGPHVRPQHFRDDN